MTEETTAGPGRAEAAGIAMLAAALGVVLMVMGYPRLIAGVVLGPQDQTIRDIAQEERVPGELLRRTAATREKALGWVESARALSDLGLLYRVLAQRAGDEESRKRLILRADAAQDRALGLGPRAAYGWMRLASGRARLGSRGAQVLRPLDLAMRLAPAEPDLIVPRLDLAFVFWRELPPDLRARFVAQVRLAARWMPTALARSARRRFAQPVVIEALATEPRLLARFIYAYSRV